MGKEYNYNGIDREYNNIEKIVTLEDGTSSLLLKEGRRAAIKIIRAGEKFQAAIYRLAFGDPAQEDSRGRKYVFAELGKHAAYNDCLKEAIGWVDEHPGEFELEEVWEPGKK